ncbi:MAG TPA: lysophospholipid acyltransferase family protein [Vicinamibacteria bacterium]|jgi:1-acyl-sn-glycerol-3-phosphate acyltransferase
MQSILATLRTVLISIPLVSLYTIVCGAVSIVLGMFFRSGNPSHWLARLWSWLILTTCGVKVLLSGLENLEKERNYIFAANHQSIYDIPILFAWLPFSFRILYKESLNRVPFLGWHLFLCGHISVDRSNPVRARQSLERAAQRVQQGTSVVVFPEGTRSTNGSIGRFKQGSFLLAIKSGVSIVPITISESWRIMKRGEVTVHPGTVRVHVERPVVVEGLEEDAALELARRVRETVLENYGAESATA